jgi:hypothetical protein
MTTFLALLAFYFIRIPFAKLVLALFIGSAAHIIPLPHLITIALSKAIEALAVIRHHHPCQSVPSGLRNASSSAQLHVLP